MRTVVATEAQLSHLSGRASHYTRTLVGLLWTAGRRNELATAIENGRCVRVRADLSRADKVPEGLSETEAAQFRNLSRDERQTRSELDSLRAALADAEGLAGELAAAGSGTGDKGFVSEVALTKATAGAARLREAVTAKRNALFCVQDARKALEARDPNFDPTPPSFAELCTIAARCGDYIVYI